VSHRFGSPGWHRAGSDLQIQQLIISIAATAPEVEFGETKERDKVNSRSVRKRVS
jgi:hypothetical protein